MKKLLLATVLTGLAPAALMANAHGPGGDHGHKAMHGPEGMFDKADANNDGAVTRQEAQAAAAAHATKMFDAADANKDGKLTREELHTAREERMEGMKERFNEHFKSADKNGDGSVSKSEASAGMPMLAKHFDEVDINKDGTVTREEMKAHHMKMKDDRHDKHGGEKHEH